MMDIEMVQFFLFCYDYLFHEVDSPGQCVRVDLDDLVLADVELLDPLVLQDGSKHSLRLLLIWVVARQKPHSLDRPQTGGVEDVHVGHLQ